LENSELAQMEELITKDLKKYKDIIRINLGTRDGNLITQIGKKCSLSDEEISSYTSSIINLSNEIMESTLKRELNYSIIKGKDLTIVSLRKKDLIFIVFTKRSIEQMSLIDELVLDLEKLATKIITLIEIPEIVRENIVSLIKKSIPLTIWIAIITRNGLPITFLNPSSIDARLSGQLAHMFETSKLLVENKIDSVILNGQEGHIIINEIDENRILAVGILEENKEKVEIYASKIKEIIKISK